MTSLMPIIREVRAILSIDVIEILLVTRLSIL